jgi:hypothetical protein
MRLWDWTRRVVVDQTGGIEPVAVDIERNPGAVLELGAEPPPEVPLYVLRVGVRGGFGGTRAGLPVHRRENPAPHPVLKEIYHCEVAGKSLEAANIYALRSKVQRHLDVIAPARSLPLCYFRAPRYDYSLGVYEEGAHLVCPVLAGPRIRAESLAEMREPVLDHLRAAGYLAADEEAEVLVLRPSDLRLVSPAAVIRCLDAANLWLPTVEGSSAEGPVVGLLSHPTELVTEVRRRRGAPAREAPPSAPDVSGLLRWVGGEMTVRGRLASPWSLYACEVRPEIWARTEELTEPTDHTLFAHLDGGTTLEVPVRHTVAGESVGAIRDLGISVFLAGDYDTLADVIGRHLAAAGFLRDPGDLRPQVISEAAPERLDPDSIWTGVPPDFGATAGRELSPQVTTHQDREVETT